MKVLVVSDIHSAISNFKQIVERVDFDILFITGDLTNFRPSDVFKIDDIVEKYCSECYAVHGNCDPESVLSLDLDNINFIHSETLELRDFTLHGIGGSTFTPFNTPSEYSEEEIREFASKLKISNNVNILITHCPPKGILDKTRFGEHVGSIAIREIAEKFDFIFCGHIHEADGIETLGKTVIANPGPAAWRKFIVFDLENSTISCKTLR